MDGEIVVRRFDGDEWPGRRVSISCGDHALFISPPYADLDSSAVQARQLAHYANCHNDLLEALGPFVALLQSHNDINEYGRPHRNDKPVFGVNDATITVGDLRKARAALEKAKGES